MEVKIDGHRMTLELITSFEAHLQENERSKATIEKYTRDVHMFYNELPAMALVNRCAVLDYKKKLIGNYAVSSVNSTLTALNTFFKYLGWHDCVTHSIRMQRDPFYPQDRELTQLDYKLLLDESRRRHNWRLALVLQTICSTGIRVSELCFITAEAVCMGYAQVRCKGKVRTVLLPGALRIMLRQYAHDNGISDGPIFVTKSGKAINRSNIWTGMKRLSEAAGVAPSKVFPHNLRHLFARAFYSAEKDIVGLADVLGHNSVETTRIYTATTSEARLAKIEALGLVL